jgi:hypothetical protein
MYSRLIPQRLAWTALNRSSYNIANWFVALHYSLAAQPQPAVMWCRASQIGLVAASSLGKCPRVLTTLRNWLWMLSMALVV